MKTPNTWKYLTNPWVKKNHKGNLKIFWTECYWKYNLTKCVGCKPKQGIEEVFIYNAYIRNQCINPEIHTEMPKVKQSQGNLEVEPSWRIYTSA